MNGNFFDIVSPKFFLPLAGKNRELNYHLLRFIDAKMDGDLLQYPREDVLDWMVEYLADCPFEIFDDATEEKSEQDLRSVAAAKLRYFVETGWLIDENDPRTLKTTYQLDSCAIAILQAMNNVVDEDDPPVEYANFGDDVFSIETPKEYTSYVYDIYTSLLGFRYDHATEIVESMYEDSRNLNRRLRSLTVSIKKYLKKLLADESMEPKDILEQFLVDYQNKVILRAFSNLRVKDNPAKYKGAILSRLENLLREENLEMMAEDYAEKKHGSNPSDAALREGKAFFDARLGAIEEQFLRIEETIETLYKKNTAYAEAANARIQFLLSEDVNMQGMLNDALKRIAEAGDAFTDYDGFPLSEIARLDEGSLYSPRVYHDKEETSVDEAELYPWSEEELKAAAERLQSETEYNVSSVSDFVLKQLGDKKQMEAKEMQIDSFSDLLKLFLAGLYSANRAVPYSLAYLPDAFLWEGKRITNYRIERKK